MASDLFRQLSQIGNVQNQQPTVGNNFPIPQNIVNQFGGVSGLTAKIREFSSLLNGNPQQIGATMLRNGTIPTQFYNQFKPVVYELMKLFPK